MRKKRNSTNIARGFRVTNASLAIFSKVGEEVVKQREPVILMGRKTRGYGNGFDMMPGGRAKRGEKKNMVSCAQREGSEESGLIGINHMVIAKIIVIIKERRTEFVIDVVLFSSWTGEVKWNEEFKELEFVPFSKINWKKILPGDRRWMKRVLIDHKPTYAEIICGKNRQDVKSIKLKDLVY